MPDQELGSQPPMESRQQEVQRAEANEVSKEDGANREQLEGELQKVEDEIKKAERERDKLREEFKKANDAEYLARLHLQKELSSNPQSVDIGILRDAQSANKALAEMSQRKLDEWDDKGASEYYRLQQRKQQIENQLRGLTV